MLSKIAALLHVEIIFDSLFLFLKSKFHKISSSAQFILNRFLRFSAGCRTAGFPPYSAENDPAKNVKEHEGVSNAKCRRRWSAVLAFLELKDDNGELTSVDRENSTKSGLCVRVRIPRFLVSFEGACRQHASYPHRNFAADVVDLEGVLSGAAWTILVRFIAENHNPTVLAM